MIRRIARAFFGGPARPRRSALPHGDHYASILIAADDLAAGAGRERLVDARGPGRRRTARSTSYT